MRLTVSFSFSWTQKLMVNSELDWVMSRTDAPERLTAEKTRAAIPRRPLSPAPETLTRATPERQDIPRTGPGPVAYWMESAGPIRVPRAEGLKLFRLQVSMRREAIGVSVLGCRTLEPKKDSSMASS